MLKDFSKVVDADQKNLVWNFQLLANRIQECLKFSIVDGYAVTMFGKFLSANVIDVFPVGSNTLTLKQIPFLVKSRLTLAWRGVEYGLGFRRANRPKING